MKPQGLSGVYLQYFFVLSGNMTFPTRPGFHFGSFFSFHPVFAEKRPNYGNLAGAVWPQNARRCHVCQGYR